MEPTKLADASDGIFRISFTLIFLVAGMGHFTQHEVMLARMEASPWFDLISTFGPPSPMLHASGVSLLVGGIGLLIGYRTRWAALLLFATLIPITASIHLAPDHAGPLFKNVALLGGLIHFAVRGPGAWSIDGPSPVASGSTAMQTGA